MASESQRAEATIAPVTRSGGMTSGEGGGLGGGGGPVTGGGGGGGELISPHRSCAPDAAEEPPVAVNWKLFPEAGCVSSTKVTAEGAEALTVA